MSMKLIGSVVAWAALAVASSAPADAVALNSANDEHYANCSSSSSAYYFYDSCHEIETYYIQNIRLQAESCSRGACSGADATTYTDFLYTPGRKLVSDSTSCYLSTLSQYELGSCSC